MSYPDKVVKYINLLNKSNQSEDMDEMEELSNQMDALYNTFNQEEFDALDNYYMEEA